MVGIEVKILWRLFFILTLVQFLSWGSACNKSFFSSFKLHILSLQRMGFVSFLNSVVCFTDPIQLCLLNWEEMRPQSHVVLYAPRCILKCLEMMSTLLIISEGFYKPVPACSSLVPLRLKVSRSVSWWRMVLSFANLLLCTPVPAAARTHWHVAREDTWEPVSSNCQRGCLRGKSSCEDYYTYVLGSIHAVQLTRFLIPFSQVREKVPPTPVCQRSCAGCAAWGSCVVCCVATGRPRRLTGTCRSTTSSVSLRLRWHDI